VITVADLVDRAIELPVVASYTRVGPAVRRRVDRWRALDTYDLRGRVIVLTGGTSGLGLAAAHRFASLGATLVMIARDPVKADHVRAGLVEQTGNRSVHLVTADLGELDQVHHAARAILTGWDRVDVLVHNAGALTVDRRTTSTGAELTVASQVDGPFLLTAVLLDRLRSAAPARVLTMSSGGMYSEALDVGHLEMDADTYRGTVAYARSKRAQVTLNEMWAERIDAGEIVFHALHPGWADTPGVRQSLPRFRRILGPLLRTADEGADTLVWLAADDGRPLEDSGRFWLDRRPRPIHLLPSTRRSDTESERRALWERCVARTGATVAVRELAAP
jgi:dehydrogenase/reductase SDR family member 12